MPTSEIAIVGAGPGGLAASLLLAHRGAKVTLYERHGRVGGRSAALERDGYRFDTGPTFFLYPQILEEIFRLIGRDLRAEVEMTKLDPQYHLLFEQGGELKASPDRDKTRASLAELSPHDAARFDDYLNDNRKKLDLFGPVLQMSFEKLSALVDPRMLRALPYMRPHKTVNSDLKRYFHDERIRLAFTFQSKYLGMSPFQCPSLFTILSFLEHEHGVYHPTGGCSAVMEAMARIAGEMGVEIRLNTPIRQMSFEGRRATGVVTDEGEHRYDAVVVNADFANAMTHLVPNQLRRRWHDKRLDRAKFSCSTFMMYLGIDGPVDLEHHTIWLAEDYARNIEAIQNGHMLFDNPSFYVQNAGVTDPTLAPKGKTALYVLIPVPHERPSINWEIEGPRYREVAYRQLAKLGLGDLRSRVETEILYTPRTWREELSVFKGATFNLAHSLDQMLYWRPHNRFEDLDGVYLVGGGTHPGSGLPVIFEGARLTTELLARDLNLAGPTTVPAPEPTTPIFAEAAE